MTWGTTALIIGWLTGFFGLFGLQSDARPDGEQSEFFSLHVLWQSFCSGIIADYDYNYNFPTVINHQPSGIDHVARACNTFVSLWLGIPLFRLYWSCGSDFGDPCSMSYFHQDFLRPFFDGKNQEEAFSLGWKGTTANARHYPVQMCPPHKTHQSLLFLVFLRTSLA